MASLSIAAAILTWFAELSTTTIFVWSGRLLGILFIPSVLLQRSSRPLSTLAWILVLLFLPYLGVLLWWGLARNYMERRSRHHIRAQKRLSQSFENLGRAKKQSEHVPYIDGALDSQTLILRDQHGFFSQTTGNRVSIHTNSSDAFDAFAGAIEQAEDHIHFQFYIWNRDELGTRFRDLLAEKARQGLEVRLLYDPVGSVHMRRRFFAPAIEAGAQVAQFLPVHVWERRLRVNFRNHRKLIIIDGQCGFTGGVNISDEYLDWFDMAFGFSGPVVHQLQEIFCEDWHFATGEDLASTRYFPKLKGHQQRRNQPEQRPSTSPRDFLALYDTVDDALARVVASGPDDRIDTLHKAFFVAINSATESLHIITPYLVPDAAILTALETASMRGVDVRIIVPGRSDVPLTQHAGRSFWEPLMEAGVQIFEFQERILHAKLMLVDGIGVLVGSANMDIRSFRLNFEANCMVESPVLHRRMSRVFEDTLDKSKKVDLETFRNRPRRTRLLEGGARLLSPLL